MEPEFIIRLIVRARNEIAGVFDKAAGDVDKLTKAQDKQTESTKSAVAADKTRAKSFEELKKQQADFNEEIRRGNIDLKDIVPQFQRFNQEFDKLSRKSPAGSARAIEIQKESAVIKQYLKDIEEANKSEKTSTLAMIKDKIAARKAEAKEEQRLIDESVAAHAEAAKQEMVASEARRARMKQDQQHRDAAARDDLRREKAATKAFETELDNRFNAALRATEKRKALEAAAPQTALDAKADLTRAVRAQQAARSSAERAAAQGRVSAQAEQLRQLPGVTERDVRTTLRKATVEAQNVTTTSASTSRSRDQNRLGSLLSQNRRRLDELEASAGKARTGLARFFNLSPENLDNISKKIKAFDRDVEQSSFSVVKFAGNLRGMIYVGAVVFFQQLVGIGIALGGTLVSVASSAIQAGAALGGALVAGAAQALPVVGLLAAAWGRVGAVFDAVKQAQKARAASAFDEAQTANRQVAAADAVRSAQEGLASAQRSAADAQQNLTDARFNAVRQIQDLVTAEKEAQLQSESAQLAQRDAQRAFKSSIATGDLSNLAQRSLAARQTVLGAATAGVTAGRATFDAHKAVAGGVEGMPDVQQARRALADANRAIGAATRGLAQANQQAKYAAQNIAGADRQLAQMLAQLSPAERTLYNALERVQKRYKAVFTGKGGVLESIINSFTYAVNRAGELLNDKKLVASAHSLSDQIGKQLNRITDFFTTPQMRAFFEQMASEASKNLPIVVTLFERLMLLVESIAKSASPALHTFLGFLADLAGAADAATGSGSGTAKLEAFFSKGEKYAEDFIKLGIAISQLFLAIIGNSAQEGNNAVESLTANINKATDWINTHQKDVQKFFHDARVATGYVGKAVWALSKALFSLFHPDQVKAFAGAFTTTLLPILTDVLSITGQISKIFLDFASTSGGSAIIRLGLTALLLQKAFSPLIGMVSRLFIVFGRLFGVAKLVDGGLVGLRVAMGPLGIVLAGVAAYLLLVHDRIHSIGDAIKYLGPLILGLGAILLAKGGGLSMLGALFGRGAGAKGAAAGAVKAAEGPLSKAAALAGLTRGSPLAGAGAGAAVGGAEVAAGGAVAAGGFAALKVGAGALLKKAGLIGIGISVSDGILAGFKAGSVKVGVRKFLDDMTFGLAGTIAKGWEQGTSALGKLLDKAGVAGKVVKFTAKWLTPAGLFGQGLNLGIKSIFGGEKKQDTGAFSAANNSHIATQDDLLHGYGVTLENVQKLARAGITLNVNNGKLEGLQKALDAANKQLEAWGKTLPQVERDTQSHFHQIARDSGVSWKNISKAVADNTAIIKLRLGADTEEGQAALAKNFEQAKNTIRDAMRDGTISVRHGLADIKKLMTKALIAGGLSPGDAEHIADHGTRRGSQASISGSSKTGSGGFGNTAATGGFMGKVGERGKDAIHAVLGRGEAVLNWGHQRLVEPAMRKMYGFGLNTMFDKVRGTHAGTSGPGFATGGFIPGPGTDFSTGQEPALAAALRRLARVMHTTIYGISGYRSPAHSVEVGGFANDPHTQGAAADIGVGSLLRASASALKESVLRSVGLYRPYYPASAAEINHVELLGKAAAGAFGSATMSAKAIASTFDHIHSPKVTGTGGIAELTRGVLHRVVTQANRTLDSLGMGGGDPTGSGRPAPPGKVRDWLTQALKTTHHYSKANLNALFGRTMQESGGNPRAINLWDSNAKAGNPSKGLLQTIGSTFQSYMLRGHGNIWNPVDNAIAAIRYMFAKYGHIVGASSTGYASGGAVPGSGPQRATVHGGEHVWTAGEVARAGGHSVIKALRMAVGGWGGGRIAEGVRQQLTGARRASAAYDFPSVEPVTPGQVGGEVAKAQGIVARLNTSIINSKHTDALSTSLEKLYGDGGLLDKLTAAVSRMTDKLATKLKQATYKYAKGIITKADPVTTANLAVGNLQKVYGALTDEQTSVQQGLDDVHKRLKQKGLSKGERNTLKGLEYNLTQRQEAIAAAIADNVEAQYQAVSDQISAQSDAANNAAASATQKLDLQDRVRSIAGSMWIGASAGQIGQQRGAILNQQADALQGAANFAAGAGHTDEANAILAQIADLRQQAVEAVVAGLSADADDIQKAADRATSAIDIRARVAQALGRVGDLAGISADRIAVAQNEIAALTKKQDEAIAGGFYDLADTIGQKIADLQASVTETAAQALQDAIDQVDKAASRQSAALDLRDRLSNLMQSAGNIAGAFGMRADTLASRGAGLSDQRAQYAALLARAQAEGNQAAVEDLSAKIADLDVSIQENSAAIRSNTNQARQAAIDAITARGGFLSSVFSGLQNVVQTLGDLSGTLDVNGIKKLLGQQGNALQETGSGLAGELVKNYGIDIRGKSASEIVALLSGVNYDATQAGMTPEEQTTFQNLINSIIENTGAQVSNTQQIKQLTNPTSQGFSSTAWTWFRNAIFNGSGGLLPQFTNPSIGLQMGDTSALVSHPTASTLAAARSGPGTGTGDVFAPSVHVTEQVETADADVITNRLMFRYKNRPRS